MGPKEFQALLTSFQLPVLTQVPDVHLLKTAYDPDTAAPVLPPFLAILGCVGAESTDLGRPLQASIASLVRKGPPPPLTFKGFTMISIGSSQGNKANQCEKVRNFPERPQNSCHP